jgi:hypothetical protein
MWHLKENIGLMHYSYHYCWGLSEKQQPPQKVVIKPQVLAHASMILEAWQLIHHQHLLNDEVFWKAYMEHCEDSRTRKHTRFRPINI